MSPLAVLARNLRDAAVATVARAAGRYEGRADIMTGRRVSLDFAGARMVARGSKP